MADCEKNILDIPVSASAPGADDVVIFTLPDGASVIRKWSVLFAGATPPDNDIEVAVSGGEINAGDTGKTYAGLVGKRIRLFRMGIKQSTINQGGSYYSFNPATGAIAWVPAAGFQEIFSIEVY